MIYDYLKPHVAKINIKHPNWGSETWGSGIAFRPKKDSQFMYLLTARHNFFEHRKYDATSDTLDLCDFEVRISLGSIKNTLLKIANEDIYFFSRNSDGNFIDIAFIAIKITDDISLHDLDVLEIYNAYDNDQSKVRNIAAGYPKHAGNNLTGNVVMQRYSMQFNSMNEDDFSERMVNPDGSLNFYDGDFIGGLQGMSGGGVFTIGKNSKLALRSIIFAAIPPNAFECVRIDSILDRINEKIKKTNNAYPKIEFSSKILLENEIISLDEIIEFEYFRNIAREKSSLSVTAIKSNDDIHRESRSLNKSYHDNKKDMDELSYKYAHLAVLACERGMRLATTLYFKKAIDLNPEHTVGLLLEKAEREGNSDALRNFTPKDILDLERKYNKILTKTEGSSERISIIKESLEEIIKVKDKKNNSADRVRVMKYFSSLLDEEVKVSKRLKPFYRYKDLADFYLLNLQDGSKSLYFYKLASCLLRNSVGYNSSKEDEKEIFERIEFLERKLKLDDEALLSIEQEAGSIIRNEESQTIMQSLQVILDDISQIKKTNIGRDEVLDSLLQDVFINGMKINKQIIQVNENKIDVATLNAVVGEFDTVTNEFKEQARSVCSSINNSLADIQGEIDKLASVNKTVSGVNDAIDSMNSRDLSVVDEVKNVTAEISASERRMVGLLNSMSVDDDTRKNIQTSIADAVGKLTNVLEYAKNLSGKSPNGYDSLLDAIGDIKSNISRFEKNFYDLSQKTQNSTKISQEATERVESAIYSLFEKRKKPLWEKLVYASYFVALAIATSMAVISYIK